MYQQNENQIKSMKLNPNIYLNTQIQWLNFSVTTILANFFMSCLFTEVHQFYLPSKKLTKYQKTVFFKYCCVTDLHMHIMPQQV